MNVPCNRMIAMHQKQMGGVDLSDQLRLKCGVERGPRTRRYWIKVYYALLDMAMTNAYLVHKHSGGSLSHKRFVIAVCNGLLTGVASTRSVLATHHYVYWLVLRSPGTAKSAQNLRMIARARA